MTPDEELDDASIVALESVMRAIAYLGPDDGLRGALQTQDASLAGLRTTHAELGGALQAIISLAITTRRLRPDRDERPIDIGPVRITLHRSPPGTECPFSRVRPGGCSYSGMADEQSSYSLHIRNRRTREKAIRVPGLAPHLITWHGFYGGEGTTWRFTPQDLAFVLELGVYRPTTRLARMRRFLAWRSAPVRLALAHGRPARLVRRLPVSVPVARWAGALAGVGLASAVTGAAGMLGGGLPSAVLAAALSLLAAFEVSHLAGWLESHRALASYRDDAGRRGRVNARGASLRGADLSWCNLDGATLDDADLRGANLAHATMRQAALRGARLADANLHEASLDDAGFQAANLRWADLRGANLRGVDLSGAHLAMADLRDAHLERACLENVDLQLAILDPVLEEPVNLWSAQLPEGQQFTDPRALVEPWRRSTAALPLRRAGETRVPTRPLPDGKAGHMAPRAGRRA